MDIRYARKDLGPRIPKLGTACVEIRSDSVDFGERNSVKPISVGYDVKISGISFRFKIIFTDGCDQSADWVKIIDAVESHKNYYVIFGDQSEDNLITVPSEGPISFTVNSGDFGVSFALPRSECLAMFSGIRTSLANFESHLITSPPSSPERD
jgi:hypothetical protein